MAVKLRLVLSITIFFLSYYGAAQTAYWKRGDSNRPEVRQQLARSKIKEARIFSLQEDLFANTLQTGKTLKQEQIVYFPDKNGLLKPFAIQESPVLSPELSLKYPWIKSYVGHSLNKDGDRVRFSVSQNGVQSMIVHASGGKATYMQRLSAVSNDYMVYDREDNHGFSMDFVCNTKAEIHSEKKVSTRKLVDGQVLRKFRIAISATGEYTEFHGGTVADALAGINATLTRVNEIFESDLGIRLELVPNNDQIIYTNKNTDPYGINLNSENQNILNTIIGAANYDVGHLFHKEFNGGDAGFIASVCVDAIKGSAYSSAVTPQGDHFDIDFVAHELGHQFGANHTWSFESEGTLVQAEPGSGSTIMGYAGIVGANNVALHGEDYFHYYSIFQIMEYVKTTGCPQIIPILNTPPELMPLVDYTIPKSTAFILIGDASDQDTDNILTYTWEQINNGIVTNNSFGPTNPSGANFRSMRPSPIPSRYFPRLGSIVAGQLTQTNPNTNSTWETVSDMAREMDFALTVRDNGLGGGQVVSETMKVTVTDQAGPFRVTSQTANETYPAGTRQEITWDVANTDQAPINAQKVDIYCSINGGASFFIKVAEGVPNTGSHEILIPGFATPAARIMVKAYDNIFLAINASDFTITPSEIVLDFAQLQFETCIGTDLTVPFTYRTFDGFYEEATFSASNMPTGLEATFSPTSQIENDSLVNITFSNTHLVDPGNYPITITATTASISKSVVIDLTLLDNSFDDVTLLSPAHEASEVSISPRLEWEPHTSYTSFDIEIAEDEAFTNIIETANSIFNSYVATQLLEGTTYYWRIKPKSNCGEGTFGLPYSFTTLNLDCTSEPATDLPQPISAMGVATLTSKIFLLNDLPIADINVNLDLTHSFLSDLVITLVSPAGTRVALVSNSCGGNKNISATFDDDGDSFVCGTQPAINGTVRPLGSLGAFKGESTFGEWTLEVRDVSPSDGGSINAFSLDICSEGLFRTDQDKDGVFDEEDLCPNTPSGTLVNLTGCPIYLFPVTNFQVEIKSESCSNLNNGSVRIVPDLNMDYQVTITGTGLHYSADFTDLYIREGLPKGTYDICILGTQGERVYEPYCFQAVINEPPPLLVTSAITPDGDQTILTLEGALEYQIELNGNLVTTSAKKIILDLEKGVNDLKVYTTLACQGVFEERIYLFGNPLASPNPFVNEVDIILDREEEAINADIFNFNGSFIETKKHIPINNRFTMDFSGQPSGLYLIKLSGKTTNSIIRLIKK